ncbi:protein mono-ADP-ribosyltransferase PARP11 isoform X3 [Rhinatrema bivittatum]|uniref:protein mono-ADP-ribosyltransferase PARP11 isoform X3 n=1 Tax=Rhinatrema bivittatum TaxID=194408 RepID=UPI001127893B|nr:protein mono-ADP-ribosyltransferase PARP11 isoform X3 [Rhinatrema bivittatum]
MPSWRTWTRLTRSGAGSTWLSAGNGTCLSSNALCSVSSEDIERSFRLDPGGSICFKTTKYNYKIEFPVMKQINLTTEKQRPVKRAPFSITAFSYICENEAIPMPAHWENVNTEEPYQLVPLLKQTHEYNEVADRFGKTVPSDRIKRVQRIQNIDLWEFFCRKKAQLKKKRGVSEINEKMLFHGTSNEFVEAICIHNFDWRVNGIHAAIYGKELDRGRKEGEGPDHRFHRQRLTCEEPHGVTNPGSQTYYQEGWLKEPNYPLGGSPEIIVTLSLFFCLFVFLKLDSL